MALHKHRHVSERAQEKLKQAQSIFQTSSKEAQLRLKRSSKAKPAQREVKNLKSSSKSSKSHLRLISLVIMLSQLSTRCLEVKFIVAAFSFTFGFVSGFNPQIPGFLGTGVHLQLRFLKLKIPAFLGTFATTCWRGAPS